jgi:hypothetical protein
MMTVSRRLVPYTRQHSIVKRSKGEGEIILRTKKRSGRISRVPCAENRAAVIHLRRPSPAGVEATYPRFMAKFGNTAPKLGQRMSFPSLFGLAHDEVCRAASVTGRAVGSCPTFSPLPSLAVYFLWHFLSASGLGIFSRSRRVPDVIRHRARLSPDFPRNSHPRRMWNCATAPSAP